MQQVMILLFRHNYANNGWIQGACNNEQWMFTPSFLYELVVCKKIEFDKRYANKHLILHHFSSLLTYLIMDFNSLV